MPEITTVDYKDDVVIKNPLISGLVEGESLENLETIVVNGTNMDAGTKIDATTVTFTKNPNYNVSVENGNLTINKGTMNIETLTPKDPDLTEDEMDLDDTTYTKVYDGTELVFNEDNIKLTYNGEELTDVTIKYYKDKARTEEITLEEIKALNVEDTKEYFITISKENFEDIETSFVVEVTRRPVTITVEDSNVIEGNSFDEAKYLSMAQNALANATTTAKGNAIINENDLGEVIASIEASLFNVVANNTDVAKLIFTVDGLEIIVENGIVNITINDNYEVTVNYGNLNVNKYIPPVTPTTPTATPTPTPTVVPTAVPTISPSVEPTPEVTTEPTIEPTTTPEIEKEDVIVKLDDEILDEEDFTIDEDGNIVLEKEFLDSLENGEYVLSVEDGTTIEESNVIVDNELPLFAFRNNTWSLFDLIVSIGSLITAIAYAFTKKNEDDYEYEKKKSSIIIVSIFAIFTILLFILTQDLTAKMVIFDIYSIIFAIAYIIQLLVMKLIKKYKEEEVTN